MLVTSPLDAWVLKYFHFQALESFLLRCPRDISYYCDEILHLTLEYLSYDPNFTDNMEEDIDEEILDEEEDEYVHLCSGVCKDPIELYLLI